MKLPKPHQLLRVSGVLLLTFPVLTHSIQDDFGADIDALFVQKSEQIDDIYTAVDTAIDRAFKGLSKRIEVKWPDGALPTKKRWVTYSADLNTRISSDFAAGKLVTETLIDDQESTQDALARAVDFSKNILAANAEEIDAQDTLLLEIEQQLKQQNLLETPSQREATASSATAVRLIDILPDDAIASLDQLSVELDPPVLSLTPSITAPEYEVTAKAAEPEPSAADNITSADTIPEPVVAIEQQDGQRKLVLSYGFISQYQQVIIENYLDEIRTHAQKYDIPVSVLLAIMETESSFNPRAVSPIPAFGLMQLVPKTAGVDAHQFVHGEKKVVSADYLFNEKNNIELGSAYYNLITNRYLRKINDPHSRFLCAIASYNTGIGNVAKTFTGKKNIGRAVNKINTMNSDEVYDHLLAHLPADETRRYLQKILSRTGQYAEFDKTPI